MRNSILTKAAILKKSGVLFNTRGYKSTSLSDITDATGFTKGAIYRHFGSKEALEKETLNYLSTAMFEKIRTLVKEENNAGDKLRAILSFFKTYTSKPPLKGGCPLMNAAIESDDANPLLRKEALKVLRILKASVQQIISNGIRYGQIRKDTDQNFYATLIIAALEGAIMMSRLEKNDEDIQVVIGHLENQIRSIEK